MASLLKRSSHRASGAHAMRARRVPWYRQRRIDACAGKPHVETTAGQSFGIEHSHKSGRAECREVLVVREQPHVVPLEEAFDTARRADHMMHLEHRHIICAP